MNIHVLNGSLLPKWLVALYAQLTMNVALTRYNGETVFSALLFFQRRFKCLVWEWSEAAVDLLLAKRNVERIPVESPPRPAATRACRRFSSKLFMEIPCEHNQPEEIAKTI